MLDTGEKKRKIKKLWERDINGNKRDLIVLELNLKAHRDCTFPKQVVISDA